MKQNKVARVYAQSLFAIGKEKNIVESLRNDLLGVQNALNAEPEYRFLFESPRISQRKKVDSINNVFAKQMSQITMNLLYVLIRKKRESSFLDICQMYETLMDEDANRVHVSLTTAVEVADQVKQNLENIVGTKLKKKIIIHHAVDKTIIGGLIVKIADSVADFSVAAQLESMKDKIISTTQLSGEVYEN